MLAPQIPKPINPIGKSEEEREGKKRTKQVISARPLIYTLRVCARNSIASWREKGSKAMLPNGLNCLDGVTKKAIEMINIRE